MRRFPVYRTARLELPTGLVQITYPSLLTGTEQELLDKWWPIVRATIEALPDTQDAEPEWAHGQERLRETERTCA